MKRFREVKKIRRYIIIPFSVIMAILIANSFFVFHKEQNALLTDDVRSHLLHVDNIFKSEVDNDAESMSALIDLIKKDKSLQDAWLAKDRDRLLDIAAPIYKDILSNYKVTHFYFHSLDKVNFLRVHNPSRHSDIIDRFTLSEANMTGVQNYGIELGPHGTFTLRVVHPWFINGKVTGYIELGEEINHIIPQVSSSAGVQMAFLIKKQLLDRELWEQGLKMTAQTVDWDELSDFIITGQTVDMPAENLSRYLINSSESPIFDLKIDGYNYRGTTSVLHDASGSEVGRKIILMNISRYLHGFYIAVMFIGMTYLLIGGVLFVFFWIFLGRLERDLVKTRSELTTTLAKQNETAKILFEKEELFRSIVDTANDGIIAINNSDEIILWNDAARDIFGYSTEEVLGRSVSMLMPDKFRKAHTDGINRAVRTGQSRITGRKVELTGLKKDNSEFPLELSLAQWKLHDVLFFTAIVRDITVRKNHERARRKSEKRFKDISENAMEWIWEVDVNGKYTYSSPLVKYILGYTPEEILTKHFYDLFHPDDREELQEVTFKAFAAKKTFREFVNRCLSKTDKEIWLSATGVPILDDVGNLIGYRGSNRNITDQREREAELKSSRDNFMALNAQLDSTAHTLTHLMEDIVEQKNLNIRFDNNSLVKCWELMKCGKTQCPSYGDLNNLRCWEVVGTFSGEKVQGQFAKKLRDCRKCKVFQSARANSLIALGETFNEMMTILEDQRKKLNKAIKDTKLANRSKSEFLANMSHEIRTPLNGIIGISELLKDTELTDKQREYFEMIILSGDTLLALINDILDVSKIEAGKLDLDSIDFRLRSSLSDTLKTFAFKASEKGLIMLSEIRLNVPDDLIGDPAKLRQITYNLIGNSLKFTRKGKIGLAVDVESMTEDEVVLHFAISDTGIGIPKDKQKLIFEAFSQADASTTREFGGTGLGLTIVSHLVKMMNGRTWIESETSSGSTFHFTAQFELNKDAKEISAATEPVALEALSVLVVDDDRTNRRIMKAIFLNWGINPLVVENGESAIEALDHGRQKNDKFDLVLLDLKMPKMDGFTLAERINADYGDIRPAIIMLSSSGEQGDAARCRKAGISAYLAKPFKQVDLLDAIQVIFSKKTSDEKQPRPLITRHSLREEKKPINILLVEDNEINQVAAVGALQSLGHIVSVAENGREAIIRLEKEQYDLIFMDIEMPVMDGIEATKKIRKSESQHMARIPIIAMTAYAMKGDRERCMQAGMDDHIPKPFTKERLVEIINSYQPDKIKVNEKTTGPQPETSEADSNASVLDLSAALEAVGGKEEVLKKMAEIFCDDMPLQLKKLRQAFADKDIDQVRRQAHRIKGASAAIRADLLTDAAHKVERAAIDGNPQEAFELFQKLEPEIENTLKTLKTPGLLD